MTDIPITKNKVTKEKEEQIRDAVRNAVNLRKLGRLALENDVDVLTFLLEDPLISNPIYTLPDKINQKTIADFIKQHLLERERGEGLLMISTDEEGGVSAYYDINVWPQWGACELGGAIRHDQQNSGQGGVGASTAFSWLFEDMGVDLICETCSLDNIRTAKLLERAGFVFKCEIESKLPAGGFRPSLYWELKKEDWHQ